MCVSVCVCVCACMHAYVSCESRKERSDKTTLELRGQDCLSQLGLGDIDFFVYHDTLGGYHDIPDILVEFKLLEIKVTLKLN